MEWDYVGPTKGIILYLHEECDPVRMEFDRDLYVQEFVKTQFSGPHVHMKVISLLRGLQVFFEDLKVEDEGEYWGTGIRLLCPNTYKGAVKRSRSWRGKSPMPK